MWIFWSGKVLVLSQGCALGTRELQKNPVVSCSGVFHFCQRTELIFGHGIHRRLQGKAGR